MVMFWVIDLYCCKGVRVMIMNEPTLKIFLLHLHVRIKELCLCSIVLLCPTKRCAVLKQ